MTHLKEVRILLKEDLVVEPLLFSERLGARADRREIRTLLAEVRDGPQAKSPYHGFPRLGVPPVDELRFVGSALSINWGRAVEPRLKAEGLGFVPDEHITRGGAVVCGQFPHSICVLVGKSARHGQRPAPTSSRAF